MSLAAFLPNCLSRRVDIAPQSAATDPPVAPDAPAAPSRWNWPTSLPAWLASMVVHLALVLVLAMIASSGMVSNPNDGAVEFQLDATGYDKASAEAIAQFDAQTPQVEALEVAVPSTDRSLKDAPLTEAPMQLEAPSPPLVNALTADALGDATLAPTLLAGGALEGRLAAILGNGLQQRLSDSARGYLLAEGGGTPGSERAVGDALAWLARHQNPDGSWTFDLTRCVNCRGQCRNPGHMRQARHAATALALLPFLGKGETQEQGQYKKTVHAGLYYLAREMKVDEHGGSLLEPQGRMYAHGLASIVLCEAFGMTQDSSLLEPAQAAINFIAYAQDPQGGGWRYEPHQAGDTSILGWQVMALASGRMAGLKIPYETLTKADAFLDSVQDSSGALYGYTASGDGPATSAIGLLCRIYLGRRADHPAQRKGVATLAEWGPSIDRSGPGRNNLYYNYYATQVLHHYGGYEWQKWNTKLRDYLIASQHKKGHQKGSWYFDGTDHGSSAGGRLYCTAMSAMILEVYYRHMPLYRTVGTTRSASK
jgi:hypothetical protein